jgi:uncharacterized membrane protein YgdD (TMEM256/DUF423 family)
MCWHNRESAGYDRPMWWTAAGIVGALGVALGAFGAHGLKGVVSDPALLVTWETAARYHLIHALALGLVAAHPGQPKLAGGLFIIGMLLFSGSLYLLVLSEQRWLGAITPLGGLALIAGWLALAFSARGA